MLGIWYGDLKIPSAIDPNIVCWCNWGVCGSSPSRVATELFPSVLTTISSPLIPPWNLLLDEGPTMSSPVQYSDGSVLLGGSISRSRLVTEEAMWDKEELLLLIPSLLLIIPSNKLWSLSSNAPKFVPFARCSVPFWWLPTDIEGGIDPSTSSMESSLSWSIGLCVLFFLYIRHNTQSSSWKER